MLYHTLKNLNSTGSTVLLIAPAFSIDQLHLPVPSRCLVSVLKDSLGIQVDFDRLGEMVGVGWSRLGLDIWRVDTFCEWS